jgi:hypothetical protein
MFDLSGIPEAKLSRFFYLSSIFNILSQVFNFSCLDGSKLSDSSFDIIETILSQPERTVT